MPNVKSHHARLCNHPVDNACSMSFLAYGVIGLFGFMNRRGSAFGHSTDEGFSFAVSIQRGVSGDHADDAAWSYVFKGEFVIILIRDYRLILRSQAFFVLET